MPCWGGPSCSQNLPLHVDYRHPASAHNDRAKFCKGDFMHELHFLAGQGSCAVLCRAAADLFLGVSQTTVTALLWFALLYCTGSFIEKWFQPKIAQMWHHQQTTVTTRATSSRIYTLPRRHVRQCTHCSGTASQAKLTEHCMPWLQAAGIAE